MEQFKRVKVVMLPTGESNLSINRSYKERGIGVEVGKPYLTYCKTFKYYSSVTDNSCNPQHLYIISDDEIKEGDWFIGDNVSLRQCTSNNAGNINFKGGWYSGSENCKKIIATTDTSLNTQNINNDTKSIVIYPQPSQQFIEKYIESYNKGEIIIDILVEYENKFDGKEYIDEQDAYGYDKFKQTLKINSKDNTITIRKLKDSWNKEEIIKLIEDYSVFDDGTVSTRNKWINNNL